MEGAVAALLTEILGGEITARSLESAMEGIHCRRRQEVLVQHGDEAELVGDARGLPKGSGAGLDAHRTSVRWSFPVSGAMHRTAIKRH